MQDISVTHQDPLVIVPVEEVITPIVSHSKITSKRTFSNAMETDQEDNH